MEVSEMKFPANVTGPVAHTDMGLTYPHEHLFNDLQYFGRRRATVCFHSNWWEESQCFDLRWG